MIQLTQNLKTGKMELSEVPVPALSKGRILVRNHFSAISAGTEAGKVSLARQGYLGKARKKPKQMKQVYDTLKEEGITSTLNKVMNKLDSLSPLGYSTAGHVIDISEQITSFKVGDYVACAGGNLANHAEVISVPENLAVHVPKTISMSDAAYTTIGSIALQGVRQADLRLGESCVVIGLGLIGQLTVQILLASGVKVIGVDIDPDSVELALKSGIDLAYKRGDGREEKSIIEYTGGVGSDAVIITAATSSLDPVEFAGTILRKKGRVVIVGSVPTGFSRDNYYNKELELKMATSYGPGRYDQKYEDKGFDYPIAYVRWTENRNMQTFIELIRTKKIDLGKLTSHTFSFNKSLEAYDMILAKKEPYFGILLSYDKERKINKDVNIKPDITKKADSNIKISFIGAGSFAQNSLLPHIKNSQKISIANTQGHTAKNIASKWGFSRATTDVESIFLEDESNIIFIATRHNSHFELVMEGLKVNKNIFVEKPLCISQKELNDLKEAYIKTNNKIYLMVGYNRRFSPHIQKIKSKFNDNSPVSINYRINAGYIPPEHWIQDKDLGGGRIIGEVCHFIDLAMYIASSKPQTLFATTIPDPFNLMDTLNVSIQFQNGSIANIAYYSNGASKLSKEYLEVFCNGVTFIVDDYKSSYIYSKSLKKKSYSGKDKGHKKQIELLLRSIKNGLSTPISFTELYYTSQMTLDVIESIVKRKIINYN